MGTPFKLKSSPDSPMQRNFGIGSTPLLDKKTSDDEKIIIQDTLPTAGDTLGAYAYQNFPELRAHPEGGPKIFEAHKKLKGHKVTKAEMLKSSKSYEKTGK